MTRIGLAVAAAVFGWLLAADRVAAVAPEVRDEGKFFGAEAIKKANEAIVEIARKADKDLLIETFASVPADDVEKVKDMTGDQRAAYFRKWAEDRVRARVVNGIYILICREPTRFQIIITEKARSTFSGADERRLQGAIIMEFREKRFDEGLLAAVKVVRDKLVGSK